MSCTKQLSGSTHHSFELASLLSHALRMLLPHITGSLSSNSLPSALSDEQWHALWEQWRYWLDCVAAQRFIPSLDQENGR